MNAPGSKGPRRRRKARAAKAPGTGGGGRARPGKGRTTVIVAGLVAALLVFEALSFALWLGRAAPGDAKRSVAVSQA